MCSSVVLSIVSAEIAILIMPAKGSVSTKLSSRTADTTWRELYVMHLSMLAPTFGMAGLPQGSGY